MTYLIETNAITIVTDPYLSNSADCKRGVRNYAPPTTLSEIMPDIIIISHGHADHLDAQTLVPFYRMRRRSFTLVPDPLVEKIQELGGEAVPMSAPEAAELGESFRLGGVTVTAVPAAHDVLHRDGDGNFFELSYLIEAEDKKIFFGGDMCMYDGLGELLTRISPDVMLLPVNGRDFFREACGIVGNLDSNEAAQLAALSGTKIFIPGHHDLYDYNGCPNEWIEYSAKKVGAPLRLLATCESVEI